MRDPIRARFWINPRLDQHGNTVAYGLKFAIHIRGFRPERKRWYQFAAGEIPLPTCDLDRALSVKRFATRYAQRKGTLPEPELLQGLV